MTIKSVAFIGAGLIGAPMARRVLQAGFELTVCDRNPAVLDAFAAEGAKVTAAASLRLAVPRGPRSSCRRSRGPRKRETPNNPSRPLRRRRPCFASEIASINRSATRFRRPRGR